MNTLPPLHGITVLQVLPELLTGGVERGTVDVASAIVRAGGRALVASLGGPMVREVERAGAEHFELDLKSKNPLKIRRNAAVLEEFARREGISLIHARSRAPAWSAFMACRKLQRPFVTTYHAPYNAKSAPKRWYNSVMARGDRVIAISNFVAGHLMAEHHTPAERIRIVHRGIDPERFNLEAVSAERTIQLAQAWRVPEDRPVILMPGRLTRWKGQTVLLEALAQMPAPRPLAILVGSDQGRTSFRAELETMIERNGLTGDVLLADHCDDMPAAYKLSDVVVHASTDPEGFGRVIAEAGAMGRPVIATNIGAPPEIVLPGETGWLVPPGDAAALAAQLIEAVTLPAHHRTIMAARATAHVRARFTVGTMTASTLMVYRDVLGHDS